MGMRNENSVAHNHLLCVQAIDRQVKYLVDVDIEICLLQKSCTNGNIV